MSRTILITGAGTGLGAASAIELAAGNRIFIHYNSSRDAAEETASRVQQAGGEAVVLQADLSTEEGCRKLAADVSEQTNALDVLVNNSGGLIRRQDVRDFEWSLMEDIFRLNTFSAFMMTSLCIPLLEKGADPNVINLTSIAMRHGAPSATIYGACKGALDSFTRGAAKELAPRIRVNAIAPGVILTPFHEKVTTPGRMKEFADNTPLGRNGNADEISSAVRFLAENTFITGETIDINGGLFMR